jgi:hypothetical protein
MRLLVGFVALMTASCVRPRVPATVAAKAQPASLDELLERNCAPCHDGSEGRIQLGAGVPLAPAHAMRAATMVAASRMPPRGSTLDGAARTRIVVELCHKSDEPARCLAALQPDPAPLIRSPAELVRAAERAVPARDEPGAARAMLLGALDKDARVVRSTVTMEILTALFAAERCGRADTQAAGSYDRCIKAILDHDLSWLPPVPEGGAR